MRRVADGRGVVAGAAEERAERRRAEADVCGAAGCEEDDGPDHGQRRQRGAVEATDVVGEPAAVGLAQGGGVGAEASAAAPATLSGPSSSKSAANGSCDAAAAA